MDEEITISREEYFKLTEAFNRLERLENAGVDNWEGYEIAMEGLDA